MNVRCYVHIFFEFVTWILGDDAGLQCAGRGVERVDYVGYFAVEDVRIGVRGDVNGVSDAHAREIVLVDVHQNPYRAHVRDGEALRRASLQQLARTYQPLHNLPGRRRWTRD